MTQPSLRQLSYLLAIAEHQSFSLAAAHCNVTQSTLSAGIKELETALGQTLVNRSHRKITLTPLGEEIAADAHKIIGQVDSLMARSRKARSPMTGVIRLGIIPTIAPYFLPRILPALQKKFPHMELQLYEDLTHRLIATLREGKLDALLMAFPFDTQDLQTASLFHENFMLAVPRTEKTNHKSIEPADLKDYNLLLLEDGHCLRDHALAACKYMPPRQRKTFNATSLPTLIQMVRHGYGATLLPEMAARDAGRDSRITLIPFKKPAPSREIGLAWHSGSPAGGNVKILAKFLKEL